MQVTFDRQVEWAAELLDFVEREIAVLTFVADNHAETQAFGWVEFKHVPRP